MVVVQQAGTSTRDIPLFVQIAETFTAIGREDAVDPTRVGFWGLSQSGWIAMEAGMRSEPAFVIAVGSPLTTPAEQMEFLAHNHVLL